MDHVVTILVVILVLVIRSKVLQVRRIPYLEFIMLHYWITVLVDLLHLDGQLRVTKFSQFIIAIIFGHSRRSSNAQVEPLWLSRRRPHRKVGRIDRPPTVVPGLLEGLVSQWYL